MNDLTSHIGAKVRELRLERRWTQGELATRLRVSQPRLSQIERGDGSFTAEQFLQLLQLFNVDVDEFTRGQAPKDRQVALQNALARLGARHLRESEEILLPAKLSDVQEVVRQTLIDGSPRALTALAPIFVEHIDRPDLSNLDATLSETGHERRLAWVVENIVHALGEVGRLDTSQSRARKTRRALFAFDHYLRFVADREAARPNRPEDLLDREVRSERGLEAVRAQSSPISRRWGVVTSIQPSDFSHALREAHAAA